MKSLSLVLVVGIAILVWATPALADQHAAFLPGFSLGLAYTPDSDYSGVGWHAAGSFEHVLSGSFEIRSRLGGMSLQGNVQGEHPQATFAFLTAEALALKTVSPVGGLGLYYANLQSPLTEQDESHFEPGVNAGLRVFILNHEVDGIGIDVLVHHVFNAGPSVIFTFGIGKVF